MNQIKTGKLIAECRKRKNLTQLQLADMLHITDRAVSKWETGRALPDSSIMIRLCEILEISVNDLLNGEIIECSNSKIENKLLLEMIKQKEVSDRRLLNIEILLGIIGILPTIISVLIVVAIPMKEWIGVVIILTSMIPFLISTPFLIMIEQRAGYYECSNCTNKYVPEYKKIFLSRHIGRKRKLKCPKCNKKVWHNKVINK